MDGSRTKPTYTGDGELIISFKLTRFINIDKCDSQGSKLFEIERRIEQSEDYHLNNG